MLFLAYFVIIVGTALGVSGLIVLGLMVRGERLGLYTWDELDKMTLWEAIKFVLRAK